MKIKQDLIHKYLLLGEDIYRDSQSIMCCFDPEENKWSSCDITLNVREFSATCYDKERYVIGGIACRCSNI